MRRPRTPGTVAALVTVGALVALAGLTAWVTSTLGFQRAGHAQGYLAGIAGCWVLFALAVLALRRVPGRLVPALVVAGTVVIGAAAMAGPPNTSTDSARYAWDGIVQDAGVSPYAHVPADAVLAPLRPEWLFPAPAAPPGDPCPQPRTMSTTEIGGSGGVLCTTINRPHVPTIYPPAAELLFAGVRAVVPVTAQYLPMQAVGFAASLGTALLLLVALRRRGADPRWAALWGWCPLVATEGITNSHIDVVGAGVAVAATLLVATGRPVRGGVLLGLAIAVKALPVLVAPPLLKRTPIRIAAAAVATVALLYAPYLVTGGPAVLGYLPGYLNEEGYDGGTRSALLSAVLPPAATTPVALLLLLAVAVVVLVRTDPADPWPGQLVVVAAALVLLSPRYAWYALLLVPPVAMTGRWEVFAVPLVLTLRQLQPGLAAFRIGLLIALGTVVVGAVVRRRARPDPERFQSVTNPEARR